MHFSQKLYVSEKTENLSEVKEKISKNEPVSGIYLICTEPGGKNLACIASSKEFLAGHSKKRDYTAIGVAKGKSDALKLFEKIVTDVALSQDGENFSSEYFRKFFE